MQLNIDNDWQERLREETGKPYFKALSDFVDAAYRDGVCYPPKDSIFRAFQLCPFSEVKVVLLGQDPYHEEGQAQGLSFSVPEGVKLPPSLRNIYKEVTADTGLAMPQSGDLSRWARQGVLLLNATLTVAQGKAGSHSRHGWETLTDAVIRLVSEGREHVVFLLWGNYAQQKAPLIDASRHLVLQSAHPSPLSAWHGFFGNHHFSSTNVYLQQWGKTPVAW